MAKLSFSIQYDMSAPTVWLEAVANHTEYTLTLETSPHKTEFSVIDGSLRYKGDNSLPVSGKVSGFEQFESNISQYLYSDGDFSVAKILGYLKNLNALGLEKYLLAKDDTVTGSAGADVLLGWAGNDLIEGGAGPDRLDGGTGVDTVSYENSANGVTVTINGKIATTGIGGDAEGDTLINFENITGSAYADTLTGDVGANVLNGGAGADILTGGKGNDTYIVDNVDDKVVELANEGIDLVKASISYSLNDNVENLTLTGIDNINGTGNALNNTLIGNDGNNTLDGGSGKDTLIGGKGDDTYVVNLIKHGSSAALEDKIIEKSNEGQDTVELHAGDLGLTKATTLKLGANLEIMDARDTGSNKLNLTGNAQDNILYGNDADNILDGSKSKTGDTLEGGKGNDTYVVNSVNDTVIEYANEGEDLVRVNITTANSTYRLSSNVENAIIISHANTNLVGNELANTLTGNNANNTIEGGAGADTLDGGKSIDTVSYAGSTSNDGILGVTVNLLTATASGNDAEGDTIKNFENITGSAFADTLTGDAGANVLDGGKGADTMAGGDGNDTYIVDNVGDKIFEDNTNKSGNSDLVRASISYTLGDNLENLTLTGSENINGTGNALNNTIIGNDGNNILNGGEGKDTLKGGKGDDTYVVDLVKSGTTAAMQDNIIEKADEGTDKLELHAGDLGLASAVTLTLAANIEIMDASATGNNKLNLTGNAVGNTLIGNTANNVLDGGAGADTLQGGAGDDTYIVDNVDDHVVELDGEGTDQVKINIATAGASFTLSSNVENATIISHVDTNLVGNNLKNIITGNDANNIIEGGAGADTLDGGKGIDTVSYAGSTSNDGILGVTVNLLTATASGNDAEGDTIKNFENITGSAFADTLTGDAGANVLDGGKGADTMAGGNGDDTYIVDNTGDTVTETSASGGTDLVLSSVDFTLGPYLENLTLTGNADINATGNDLDNILIGNSGNNHLIGGAGNDTLDGGSGADILEGGAGNDTYKVDLIAISSTQVVLEDTIIENNNEGTDTLQLFYHDRNSNLGTGPFPITLGANLENMDASQADINHLNLLGNGLDNIIIGNSKDNSIDGGAGNDTLIGGDGADTLTGGLGADIFVFNVAPSASNIDHITDFSSGDGDKLNLLKSLFANALTTGKTLNASDFLSTATPLATATQHIVYDNSNGLDGGKLYYNSDGSGSGALVLIGVLDGHPTLLSTDISLI